jgi:hypothetical protein
MTLSSFFLSFSSRRGVGIFHFAGSYKPHIHCNVSAIPVTVDHLRSDTAVSHLFSPADLIQFMIQNVPPLSVLSNY